MNKKNKKCGVCEKEVGSAYIQSVLVCDRCFYLVRRKGVEKARVISKSLFSCELGGLTHGFGGTN